MKIKLTILYKMIAHVCPSLPTVVLAIWIISQSFVRRHTENPYLWKTFGLRLSRSPQLVICLWLYTYIYNIHNIHYAYINMHTCTAYIYINIYIHIKTYRYSYAYTCTQYKKTCGCVLHGCMGFHAISGLRNTNRRFTKRTETH